MNSNYLNLLGLVYRARKCSLGEENIIKDIQKKRAKLVLLANDIGQQTKKKMMDKCQTYDIPLIVLDVDRNTLSQAIGKQQRVAIAILDDGFANKVLSLLE